MQDKNVEDLYPLSPIQQGLLFHSVATPELGAYFEQIHWRYAGPIAPGALRGAWERVLARHPILRTGFFWQDLEQAVQVVRLHVELPWVVLDWCRLPAETVESAFAAFCRADARRGFDLRRAPLMRCTLIKTGDASYRFLWSYHHLLLDGWSAALVLGEVGRLYAAALAGAETELPRRRRYRDYVAWQRRLDQDLAAAWWRETLAGLVPHPPLAAEHPARTLAPGEPVYARLRHELDTERTTAVHAAARRWRTTLNTVVQGAWAILLAHQTGVRDVVFGHVVAGRPSELHGAEEMIGLFVNTLPVRAQIDPAVPVGDWLRRFQTQQSAMRAHELSPLTEIVRWSGVPREPALFSTLVAFENHPARATDFPHAALATPPSQASHPYAVTGYPLTIVIEPHDRLAFAVLYDRRRFAAGELERLLAQLAALLAQMSAEPEPRLGELRPMAPGEEAQLLDERAQGEHDPWHELSIPALFALRAERASEAVAAVFGEHQLSCGELARLSRGLARRLRDAGTRRGERIGLLCERSLEMVVAMLAILEAGAAYVPLDPATPEQRLAFVLADAGLTRVLAERALGSRLPGSTPPVTWLEPLAPAPEPSAAGPRVELDGDDLAYVMYTSGSTGQPKGVAVPHRGLVSMAQRARFVDFSAEQSFLHLAPIAFDASCFEIWGALLGGARLEIYPPTPPALEPLGRFLRERRVSTAWLTADLFHQMVGTRLGGLAGLRQLVAGGDVLEPEAVRQVVEQLPGCRMVNGYGPTETTVFCCCHPLGGVVDRDASVPIGRAFAGVRLYVVDTRLRLVAQGLVGELLIGGVGLARGYFGRPGTTAERFVPDPFGGAGGRLYRSGDLVRRRLDGALEFRGRADRQVKLRGFRIELGEIEAVLARHPDLAQVAVVARGKGEQRQLLAGCVPTAGRPMPAAAELRGFLRRQLPEHMVPAHFAELAAMPLTATGKLDRRALAALALEPASSAGREAAPQNDREGRVAAIWQELLDLAHVGVFDNFFDLGGNSLLMLRLHRRLEQELGISVPILKLFDRPNVRAQAELLAPAHEDATTVVDERPDKLESAKTRLRHQLGRSQRSREIAR